MQEIPRSAPSPPPRPPRVRGWIGIGAVVAVGFVPVAVALRAERADLQRRELEAAALHIEATPATGCRALGRGRAWYTVGYVFSVPGGRGERVVQAREPCYRGYDRLTSYKVCYNATDAADYGLYPARVVCGRP